MESKNIADLLAQHCHDKKGENVVILDLQKHSSVADYFVICSGFSDRQVSAIADSAMDELKKAGATHCRAEGIRDGRWALVDFGSVILHVFLDSLRDYYNLEGLWHDAPRTRIRDTDGDPNDNDERDTYKPSDFEPGHARF